MLKKVKSCRRKDGEEKIICLMRICNSVQKLNFYILNVLFFVYLFNHHHLYYLLHSSFNFVFFLQWLIFAFFLCSSFLFTLIIYYLFISFSYLIYTPILSYLLIFSSIPLSFFGWNVLLYIHTYYICHFWP